MSVESFELHDEVEDIDEPPNVDILVQLSRVVFILFCNLFLLKFEVFLGF